MLSVLLFLICTVSWASAVTNASVDVVCATSSPSSCQVVPSQLGARASANNGQLASAWLSDSYNETGWAHLEIAAFQAVHIHSAAIDNLQAYAAGLAEGYLTGVKVSQHSTNTFASYWGTGLPPQPFVDYIETNLAYMRKQADSLGPSDAFWHQVGLILTQMQGVLDGSNMKLAESKMQKLSFFDIMISNIDAEIGDILPAVLPHDGDIVFPSSMDLRRKSHCSAALSIAPDLSDIFIGHATWCNYDSMLRIFKHYNLQYTKPQVSSFSSYPGTISSIDDFYMLPTMSVLETTNAVLKLNVSAISPIGTVPTFIRAQVANTLATGGKDWTEIFSRENSGTYNNQWMVLDHGKFTPGKPLINDTLWVLEQIPGFTKAHDLTYELIKQNYWASYNVPFFATIAEMSGVSRQCYRGWDEYCHKHCARAHMFKRDMSNVSSVSDMQRVLRSFDLSDPLSKGRAIRQIAARFDLEDIKPSCGGAIDAKVSSIMLGIQNRTAYIISGPPSEHAPELVWDHNIACQNVTHDGIPNHFAFPWVTASVQHTRYGY